MLVRITARIKINAPDPAVKDLISDKLTRIFYEEKSKVDFHG